MFIHTNPALSRVFSVLRGAPKQGLPILLTGRAGSSKFSYIKALIRDMACQQGYHPFANPHAPQTGECSCTFCTKIKTGKAIDITVLTGREGVADFREALSEFRTHQPIELAHKYLIIRNASMYTKDTLDTLLKTLEEPLPHQRIYLTASEPELLPPAIRSRCHIYRQPPLSKTSLESIVKWNQALVPYARSLDKYDFQSLRQVISYTRLDLENRFKDLFIDTTAPDVLEEKVKKLLDAIEDDIDHPAGENREFVLSFFLDRLRWYVHNNMDVNPGMALYEAHLNVLLDRFKPSLLKHLKSSRISTYINLENQFAAFLLGHLMLRRICNW